MHPRPSPHTTLSLRFSVHWTRTSSRAPRVPRTALPPGMHLRAGRPDINATMQTVIAGVRDAYSTTGRGRSQSQGTVSPSGIVIGSCGPSALIDDATRAVGRVSWADWKEVGGVESIEECVLQNENFLFSMRLTIEQGIRMVIVFLLGGNNDKRRMSYRCTSDSGPLFFLYMSAGRLAPLEYCRLCISGQCVFKGKCIYGSWHTYAPRCFFFGLCTLSQSLWHYTIELSCGSPDC